MKKVCSLSVLLALLLAMSLCVLAPSAAGANLASGKKADYTPNPTEAYNTNLTDGVKESAFSLAAGKFTLFSWNPSGTPDQSTNAKNGLGVVTVDLGSAQNVGSVSLHMLTGMTSSGVCGPKSVKVSVSADNSTWTDLATKEFDTITADDFRNWDKTDGNNPHPYKVEDLVVEGKNAVSGRYVRIELTLNGLSHIALDEVEVYAGEGSAASDNSSAASSAASSNAGASSTVSASSNAGTSSNAGASSTASAGTTTAPVQSGDHGIAVYVVIAVAMGIIACAAVVHHVKQ